MPRLCALLVLVLAPWVGCVNTEALEAEVAQLELSVRTQRERLLGLHTVEERVLALEALESTPDSGVSERVALLEAEVLALREQIRALGGEIGRLEAARVDPARGVRLKGKTAPPPAGEALEVLSVGSGSLLLVRTAKRLERVRLLGVDAPRRAVQYDQDPPRLRRHLQAFRDAEADALWKASRDHLASLVGGRRVRLAYPEGGPRRGGDGAWGAYVELPPNDGQDAVADVGAVQLESGYALAEGKHERAPAYKALETAARAAGAGLLAAPSRE